MDTTMDALTTFTQPSWARAAKLLPDGRMAAVVRMIFTWKLIVGAPENKAYYDDGWCYDTESAALVAMTLWDGTGEPTGWIRHPPSGRRRPGGKASLEYVAH